MMDTKYRIVTDGAKFRIEQLIEVEVTRYKKAKWYQLNHHLHPSCYFGRRYYEKETKWAVLDSYLRPRSPYAITHNPTEFDSKGEAVAWLRGQIGDRGMSDQYVQEWYVC